MKCSKNLRRLIVISLAFPLVYLSTQLAGQEGPHFETGPRPGIVGQSKVGYTCYCLDVELDEVKTSRNDLYGFTTFLSIEQLSRVSFKSEVPCEESANICFYAAPVSGLFKLLAMTHPSPLTRHENITVSTNNIDALSKLREFPLNNYLSSRRDLNISLKERLPPKVGSGMLLLRNGCVRVSGCRKLGSSKMSVFQQQEKCSGYTDQTISNTTVCITEKRGHNRMRCDLKQSRSRRLLEHIWVASLGPYYTFQHFVLDKLPELLVAHDLLRSIPNFKYLTIVDKRSLEILEFLGLHKNLITNARQDKSICAKKLVVNAPLPGKYGFSSDENFPRPPELFKYASHKFQLNSNGAEAVQNLIVYLDRGASAPKSTKISNIREIKSVLKRNNFNLTFLSINPSQLSIKDLVATMQKARVIVGVHGGQMANIVFAKASKNTKIIEIAGRQTYWKSYYYNGMSSVFDYHVLPRLCKSGSVRIHPNELDLKGRRCTSSLYVSIYDLKSSLNLALGIGK